MQQHAGRNQEMEERQARSSVHTAPVVHRILAVAGIVRPEDILVEGGSYRRRVGWEEELVHSGPTVADHSLAEEGAVPIDRAAVPAVG